MHFFKNVNNVKQQAYIAIQWNYKRIDDISINRWFALVALKKYIIKISVGEKQVSE